MSMAFKAVKANTWEEFVSVSFMYAKVAFIVLYLMSEPRSALFYSILCFVLWLILKQPIYNGPSKMVKVRSGDHFYDDIMGHE
jgi:hypothetical protein